MQCTKYSKSFQRLKNFPTFCIFVLYHIHGGFAFEAMHKIKSFDFITASGSNTHRIYELWTWFTLYGGGSTIVIISDSFVWKICVRQIKTLIKHTIKQCRKTVEIVCFLARKENQLNRFSPTLSLLP